MTPAVTAARRAGIPFRLHEYRHQSGVRAYGDEAAAALGVEPARVFKTLVAVTDPVGALVVAMVPVVGRLDLKRLAGACGAKRAVLADAAAAERATGYVLGGISPLGQRRRLPTLLDESAARFATVFVSAGRRGLELELAPGDLLRLCGAELRPITKEEP